MWYWLCYDLICFFEQAISNKQINTGDVEGVLSLMFEGFVSLCLSRIFSLYTHFYTIFLKEACIHATNPIMPYLHALKTRLVKCKYEFNVTWNLVLSAQFCAKLHRFKSKFIHWSLFLKRPVLQYLHDYCCFSINITIVKETKGQQSYASWRNGNAANIACILDY